MHVAPEGGLSRITKAHSNIDYLTVDISEYNAMSRMDITDINYPSERFDEIIGNHILEHIVDDGRAMSELNRVLKPGSWGILQVPVSLSLKKTHEDCSVTDPSERETVFGQPDNVRIYGMNYLERLKNTGFRVNRLDSQKDPKFSERSNRSGLLRSEIIFVANKL